MVINLERSRLAAPMFDGCGFMANGHYVRYPKVFYVKGTGYEPVPKVI